MNISYHITSFHYLNYTVSLKSRGSYSFGKMPKPWAASSVRPNSRTYIASFFTLQIPISRFYFPHPSSSSSIFDSLKNMHASWDYQKNATTSDTHTHTQNVCTSVTCPPPNFGSFFSITYKINKQKQFICFKALPSKTFVAFPQLSLSLFYSIQFSFDFET